MKKYALAILLFIPVYVALVVCCTPTLYPIYTDEDIVYDPSLIGVWDGGCVGFSCSDDSRLILEFTPYGDNAYHVLATMGEGTGTIIAHLVNIGDYLYLDTYPDQMALDENNLTYDWLFMTHRFSRVERIGAELIFTDIDPDWLTVYLRENPDVITSYSFQDADDYGAFLITAPTEEFQAWLIENAEELKLHETQSTYTRVTEDEDASDDDDETVEENEVVEDE